MDTELRQRVRSRVAAAKVAHLNRELGTAERPCAWSKLDGFSDLGSEHYFYKVPWGRAQIVEDLGRLERLEADGRVEPGSKTLITHIRLASDLEIVRKILDKFANQHVFVELWGQSDDYHLLAAGFWNLYYLPVTGPTYEYSHFERSGDKAVVEPGHYPVERGRPSSDKVFVSLGRGDDLALIEAVISENRELRFVAPRWAKSADGTFTLEHTLRGPNVVLFDNQSQDTYVREYLDCEVALVLTRPQTGMKGGLRVADALGLGRYLVANSNRARQVALALDEENCLVADTVGEISESLRRIFAGEFRVNPKLCSEVRRLMHPLHKLEMMLRPALKLPLPDGAPLRPGPLESVLPELSSGLRFPLHSEPLAELFLRESPWRLEEGVVQPSGHRVRLVVQTNEGPIQVICERASTRSFFNRAGVALSYRTAGDPLGSRRADQLRRLAPGIISILRTTIENPLVAVALKRPRTGPGAT